MDKVYIVTTGEYSDFAIECVFSTREQAKAYWEKLDAKNAFSPEVHEFAVDEIRESYLPNYFLYDVSVEFPFGNPQVVRICESSALAGYTSLGLPENLKPRCNCRVWALSEEDAADKVLQMVRERMVSE